MNENQFQLRIPQPCTMPWGEMQFVDPGKRHCSSCDKVVIDFTSMSDEEVIQFFHKNGRTCGQLRDDQMNRLFIPAQTKPNTFRKLFLLPSFLIGISAAAQTTDKPQSSSVVISTTTNPSYDATFQRMVTVKGFVSTPDSLPCRTVVNVSNGRDTISKFSGHDGYYNIQVPCFVTDSIVVKASESSDFEKIFYADIENDTLMCDIHFMPGRPILDTITVTSTVGDIAIDPSPRQKFKRFFYRLFHPFRFRKNR